MKKIAAIGRENVEKRRRELERLEEATRKIRAIRKERAETRLSVEETLVKQTKKIYPNISRKVCALRLLEPLRLVVQNSSQTFCRPNAFFLVFVFVKQHYSSFAGLRHQTTQDIEDLFGFFGDFFFVSFTKASSTESLVSALSSRIACIFRVASSNR